ncbi:hypothetical protein [Ferrimonas aestuarii]|uniref:Uncharacterized protein n=1 Tax=Ferrimonas aestuarii TaxID=2569539 RepID=A0A4U1BLU7_9GAMM|nr:hypothetical protein [Ferrimonas aestuarii]TKB53952.1 hypothetical protein FCL42_13430 [Ferrimonas aestuarii]
MKKSLIALAIASIATTASAANLADNTTAGIVSVEGNALHTQITAPTVSVVLGAEYTVGDLITFTISGAELDTTTVPATISVAQNDTPTPDLIGITLGLLNKTATTATYRVTELDSSGLTEAPTTIGQQIDLTGLVVKADTLGSKATIAYTAETANGQELDSSAKNSGDLLVAKTQFVAAVADDFDAIIDVNEQRLKFSTTSGGAIDAVSDDLDATVTDNNSSWLNAGTPGKTTFTVSGDFAFLDSDKDTDGIQPAADVVKPSGSPASVKVTENAITVEYTAFTSAFTLTLDLNGATANTEALTSPIGTQEFGLDVDVEFAANSKTATADVAELEAGAWELNGAVVHVPFMPFRDGFSPIVNISNVSTQEGDIEVMVYYSSTEDKKPESFMLGVAAAPEAQTNITSALQKAGIEGDVALDIIVNAPKDDIEVNALYFQGGDRAVINTVKQ